MVWCDGTHCLPLASCSTAAAQHGFQVEAAGREHSLHAQQNVEPSGVGAGPAALGQGTRGGIPPLGEKGCAMTHIPYDAYRAKVFGCWLGKSIGGTLGGPWEGRTPPRELTYYDPVPTAILENDDLDLQLVWLAHLRESGFPITGTVFARAWPENIQAWPDEYGVCIRNLAHGLRPPLSGAYDNGFTAGMGAAIRTELWACLAPGDAALARRLAREDARSDHAGEGVYAAEFLATIESLAFVESDRERLIDAGLQAIPAPSRVAQTVRFVQEEWAQQPNRAAVFERLNQVHGQQNFTDVAINLAIVVLGWYAGGGDFGRSILAAVNCGYDADCTCATLGAILGLIAPQSIGEEWKKPIGEKVAIGGYITGIAAPATLADLTDITGDLAQKALAFYRSPVRLTQAPTPRTAGVERYPAGAARVLRMLPVPDSASVLADYPLHIRLDYPDAVRVAPGQPGRFCLVATNPTSQAIETTITLRAPLGWQLGRRTRLRALIAPHASVSLPFTATPTDGAWRPYASALGVRCSLNGVVQELSAGLLLTIPVAVWSVDALTDKEPQCPAAAQCVEATSHTLDLAPYAHADRVLVAQLECKDFISRDSKRRFVVQTAAATTLWINGAKVLAHDGTWHVGALHRAENTCADVVVTSPVRLTVAVCGGTPGELFHAIGELTGNCNRWAARVEYRRPEGLA
jgi:ADP-ribosylglycohydrolase